jgi:hypothetical protein
MEKYYKVSYSRLLAGGERVSVVNQVMIEKDIKSLYLDESRFKYIVLSSELMSQEEIERDQTIIDS